MPEGIEIEFLPGQSLYLRAFHHLIHDRQFAGMAGVPLPIPYGVVSQYARDHDLPSDEFPVFFQMVRALDDEWRAFMTAKTVPAKTPG